MKDTVNEVMSASEAREPVDIHQSMMLLEYGNLIR